MKFPEDEQEPRNGYGQCLPSPFTSPWHAETLSTTPGCPESQWLVSFWGHTCRPALAQLNILACGVVGAYSVVLAVGSYVSTSLTYITLNVLRRALNVDFRGAVIRAPFQTNGKPLESNLE